MSEKESREEGVEGVDIVDDESIELPEGESFMLLLIGSDGSYRCMDIAGIPSEEQIRFVEDLAILENRSFVMGFVMFIERIFLRVSSWYRERLYGGKL